MRIRGGEIRELVTLGSLDPRRLSGRLCGIVSFVVKAFVASWDLCDQDLLCSF